MTFIPRRVAVTSRSFSRHPALRAELQARYPNTTFNDQGRWLGGDDLVAFLTGHDAAIVALERLSADVLDRLPDLRAVSKYGVGLDALDLGAMSSRGVRLGWSGGVNRRSVAELVIAFAISLFRELPAAVALVQGGGWKQTRGRQLSGRTVGVIGCGHVGKEVVQLLAPFGCRVLVHDIVTYADFYEEHGVTPCGLDALLAESELVTLHVPLTPSTRMMFDERRLSQMRPSALLINTARGGLVDERALKARLLSGAIAGAAFDVFDQEPPSDRELLALPSFVATPHIGGSTDEAVLAMGRAAIDGLAMTREIGGGWPC